MSTKFPGQKRYSRILAGDKHHLGHLAKVGVAGSNPVVRSRRVPGQEAASGPGRVPDRCGVAEGRRLRVALLVALVRGLVGERGDAVVVCVYVRELQLDLTPTVEQPLA